MTSTPQPAEEEATIVGRVDAGIVRVDAEPVGEPSLASFDTVGDDGEFEVTLPLDDGPVVLRVFDVEGVELYAAIVDSLRSDDGIVFAPRIDAESRLEVKLFEHLQGIGTPISLDTVDLREQVGPKMAAAFSEVHPHDKQHALRELASALRDRELAQRDLSDLVKDPEADREALRLARLEPAQRMNEGLFNGEGLELLQKVYSQEVSTELLNAGFDLGEQFDLEMHGVRQAHLTLLRLRARWPALYESIVIETGMAQARSFARSTLVILGSVGATDMELAAVRGLNEEMMLGLRLADTETEADEAFEAFRTDLFYGAGRPAFVRLFGATIDEDAALDALMAIAREEATAFDEALGAALTDDMDVEERARVARELYGDLRLGIEVQIGERLPELVFGDMLIGLLSHIAVVWTPTRSVRPFPLTDRVD